MQTIEELATRDLKQGMKFLRTLTREELEQLLNINMLDQIAARRYASFTASEKPKELHSLRALKLERARILTLVSERLVE